MQSEVSIAKPLSGPECLEACLYALKSALGKDDRFMNHVAYSGFAATIEFKFRPSLSFVPDVERTVVVGEGDQTQLEEKPTVEEKITLAQRPPNQVREEAEMPQPVLVTDGQGQSREEWKKVGRPPKQGERPKVNRVRGAV